MLRKRWAFSKFGNFSLHGCDNVIIQMLSNETIDNRPIGVFDSGLGGLTVVREIKKKFPGQQIIYLGDTARVPYGTRSKEIVTQFAMEDLKFLLKFDPKAIIIACNTVSALAAKEVRKSAGKIPVWDVIGPGVTGATKATKNKRIGVIGTRGTIRSQAYQRALNGMEVFAQACPLFVPFVEEGEVAGDLIEDLAAKYLKFVKENGVDTLILGCTHYPVIYKVIKKTVGEKVVLINTGEELAKEIKIIGGQKKANDMFFATDLTEKSLEMAKKILETDVKISVVKI